MIPLITLSVFAIALLYIGLTKSQKSLLPVSVVGLALAAQGALFESAYASFLYTELNIPLDVRQMIHIDTEAGNVILVMISTTILLLLLSGNYFHKISEHVAEYYALIFFALAGAIVMVSCRDLTMLFIGIEILSVSLYILTGIKKKDSSSNEAALKYFLMGAFFTCFLLLGIAFIYGATGTFSMDDISTISIQNQPLFHIGVILVMIGLCFKISAAPFHFWTPDVYQGAPTLITAFMSTVVKTAGIIAFFHLFTAFRMDSQAWKYTFTGIIVLTLLIGNVTAAYQRNVKRLLAYSGISHVGYMLIAILSLIGSSYQAALSIILFYVVAYSIASVACFGVIILIKNQEGSDELSSFEGLSKRNPFLAFIMTISLLSMAGIPLTGGFLGKFFVFTAAIENGWLVIFALLMASVAVYYYFKIINAMYFTASKTVEKLNVSFAYKFVLIFCTLGTILLGIFPGLFNIFLL